MSPERIKDPSSQETLEIAIVSIEAAIGGFHESPNPENLIHTAKQVWTNLISKTELRNKIEEEIKIKRIALNQMIPIDIVHDGDPVKRRYDPYKWEEKIPVEYIYRQGDFFLQRSRTLLEFLKTFQQPPNLTR